MSASLYVILIVLIAIFLITNLGCDFRGESFKWCTLHFLKKNHLNGVLPDCISVYHLCA